MTEKLRCIPCGEKWTAQPPHDFTCPACEGKGTAVDASPLPEEPFPGTMKEVIEHLKSTPPQQTAPSFAVGNPAVDIDVDSVLLGSFFWIGYQLGRTRSEATTVVRRLRELLSSAKAGQL